MPTRSSLPPEPGSALPDAALRIKDGLRELRTVARAGTQQLVSHLREVHETAPPWAPPLAEVVALAANTAERLDRLASRWLTSSESFRQMDYPLMTTHAGSGLTLLGSDPSMVARSLYWTLRHLARLAGRDDVMVREEAVHQAVQQVVRAHAEPWPKDLDALAGEMAAGDAARAWQLTLLIQALCDHATVHLPVVRGMPKDVAGTPAEDSARTLNRFLAWAAVFAGEAALNSSLSEDHDLASSDQKAATLRALQGALHLAQARKDRIQAAFEAQVMTVALFREVAFVLRHL